MKAHRGGAGGYGGMAECCFCTYKIVFHDGNGGDSSSGVFCGDYGDSNCDNGIHRWIDAKIDFYLGDEYDVDLQCV